jgi:hypothetical protein
VQAILGDINIQGHVRVLVTILESATWRDLWEPLHLPLRTFADLGLVRNASDAEVWQLCQQQGIILLTANRNAAGPDSLENTIRNESTARSLPVLTVADPDQILHSKHYAERVAAQLLDYLLNIEQLRGTGRLYLP